MTSKGAFPASITLALAFITTTISHQKKECRKAKEDRQQERKLNTLE